MRDTHDMTMTMIRGRRKSGILNEPSGRKTTRAGLEVKLHYDVALIHPCPSN